MTQQLLVAPGREGAHQRIGDALSAVGDEGAVVVLAAGTYYEALFVTDKSVTLVAEQGPGSVVIDVSSSAYNAVTCKDSQVTVRDVTLKASTGAAVSAEGGRLTVENCTLFGAGEAVVAVTGTAYAISRATIAGSVRTDSADGQVDFGQIAGAVLLNGTSRATLSNVTLQSITYEPGAKAIVDNCADAENNRVRPRKAGAAPDDGTKRPPALYAAVVLLVPAVILWGAATVGCIRILVHADGDGVVFTYVIFTLFALITAAFTLMHVVSALLVYFGTRENGFPQAAGITAGLCLVAIVSLLIQGKIEWNSTMVGPLVAGAAAAAAIAAYNTKPVARYLGDQRRSAAE
ncbi:right-handed parallel beta-helix repeat-containing protein [Actinoplanes sp. RD1]|uniref:hypothetical protein n=1 Tax=Actinoplanes sp. RD1 TaxID=3064538 RepID=UPI002742832C|nr:hypothetical protein [Actinoplanes sp. RD1]